MKLLDVSPGEARSLAASPTTPEQVHVFDRREIEAVNAALAARRPLLVRGEPGIGKSQLARAVAKAMGRAFLQHVVDARTESRDLQWHFDAVARLADAQLMGALGRGEGQDETQALDESQAPVRARDRLAIQHYIHPRALWWAFDWDSATTQAQAVGEPPPAQPDGGDPANGCLVLIDEIDKAEADVPNGLLEALGAGGFAVPGKPERVQARGETPLVVITTNEERTLPDAFIRRCLVLHLALPKGRQALIEHLVARGRAHFPGASKSVLERAADLLIEDRQTARHEHWLPLPGQAEYLDLVRAVLDLAAHDTRRPRRTPEAILDQVAGYVLAKHPDAFRRRQEASE